MALSRPRRVTRPGGLLVSLLLHALVVVLLVTPTIKFLDARDPGSTLFEAGGGGGGGGGGSGAVAYISLPALTPPPPPEEEVVAPPVETPEVPVVPEPQPARDSVVERVEVAVADSGPGKAPGPEGAGPGSGGGSGGGTGGGTGPGTGPGSGPGSGGTGGLEQPPSLRQLILVPENKPRDLRGKTITITFWIRADGRVERVEFDPEIRDRDYASKFRERLLGYVFQPARSASGIPVAARYPMEFTF